ncbi:MAG: hypothetical protein LBV29_02205 [Azoarcus sp.]|nr:hypothetical protein [Azoarcus sp.]
MNPPPRSEDHMVSNPQIIPEESERIQALRDAGKDFARVVTVPAANNIVSNSVIIATLMMRSGSAPVDSLFELLREGKEQAVAVVGKNDALTAATIEAAIQQLGDNPTATTILFAGKSKYVKELQKLSEKASVPFEGVDFPTSQEKDSPSSQEKDPS